MKYVPDTSTIINGHFLKYLSDQKKADSIILSRVVIAEIENMANLAKTAGITALEELQRMRDFCAKNGVNMIIDGYRPTVGQIKGAPGGELDSQIRDLAAEYDAILVTSDRVMAEIGKDEGLDVAFIKEESKSLGKKIEDYFDDQIMSIHLRENNFPLVLLDDEEILKVIVEKLKKL